MWHFALHLENFSVSQDCSQVPLYCLCLFVPITSRFPNSWTKSHSKITNYMIATKFWVIFPLGILLIIQTWLLNSHYPYIASDMYYYLTRLIDTYIHMKVNSVFSVQWWTPTFGGGVPAFPNPLHLQFSITPYIMFFFSPWVSCQITYMLMASLGYFFNI